MFYCIHKKPSQQQKANNGEDQEEHSGPDVWQTGWQEQNKTLNNLSKLRTKMQAAQANAIDTIEAMKQPSWKKVAGWRPELEERYVF